MPRMLLYQAGYAYVLAPISTPGSPSLIDMRDDLRHAPPILTAGRFEMPDFDGDMSFAADADGFVERGNDGVAFAAHVSGVDAAELGALGGESDQFFGGGIGCGRVLQRVDTPTAPSRIASRTSAFIRSSSAGVGARSPSPITALRTCVAPT